MNVTYFNDEEDKALQAERKAKMAKAPTTTGNSSEPAVKAVRQPSLAIDRNASFGWRASHQPPATWRVSG